MKKKGPSHRIAAAVVTLQLVICAQLLFAFIFQRWDKGLTGDPNLVCVTELDGWAECIPTFGSVAVSVTVVFCSYTPLPLVLFAGLSFLFGACLQDAGALLFSTAAQALAAVMTLIAVASSFVGYGDLLQLPGFAAVIATRVCACVEMGVAATLCWESVRRLNRQRRNDLTVSTV